MISGSFRASLPRPNGLQASVTMPRFCFLRPSVLGPSKDGSQFDLVQGHTSCFNDGIQMFWFKIGNADGTDQANFWAVTKACQASTYLPRFGNGQWIKRHRSSRAPCEQGILECWLRHHHSHGIFLVILR